MMVRRLCGYMVKAIGNREIKFFGNIINPFQKGLKARPMSTQGERSEPWDITKKPCQ